MDIRDIITRNTVSQDEMQFVISEYIHEKRNYRPEINILRGLPVNQIPEPMLHMILQQQLQLMTAAYNIAYEYFMDKLKINHPTQE